MEFKCNSPILSVIISHQIQKADALGILFQLNIEDVSLESFDDLDITTIFANLLDNSIEACAQLPQEQRNVCLTLKQFNSFIAISISNPISDVPEKVGAVYKTTKENHDGIGLTNVKNAVKRYNGEFNATVDGNRFVVKAVISIPI